MQELTKNSKASIINLFEKMDSNITKFRASIQQSPHTQQPKILRQQHVNCTCQQDNKYRRLEREFYLGQQQSVSKVAQIFKDEGNQTWAKLLNFMSDYLVKIITQLGHSLVCSCKQAKIEQYADLCHKIAFLREQNHKFFRMIEEKTQECELLKIKIQQLQLMKKTKNMETPLAVHLLPSANLTSELTSMIASSNTSRISQFRHIWPELTLPGDFGHRRYFEESPGERCTSISSRTVLLQKPVNMAVESTFRKAKIFQHL